MRQRCCPGSENRLWQVKSGPALYKAPNSKLVAVMVCRVSLRETVQSRLIIAPYACAAAR
jgi:hypothetical protein